MKNKAMERKLKSKEAIDLSTFPQTIVGDYVLDDLDFEGMDLCNAETEKWIRSVGKHKQSGFVLASETNKFYQNPDFECLWLR